jgi:hypothetical protein
MARHSPLSACTSRRLRALFWFAPIADLCVDSSICQNDVAAAAMSTGTAFAAARALPQSSHGSYVMAQ